MFRIRHTQNIKLFLLHTFFYFYGFLSEYCRLAIVLSLYILGGLIFTVGYKKAEGKQRIPNIEFWSAMPGWVKVCLGQSLLQIVGRKEIFDMLAKS